MHAVCDPKTAWDDIALQTIESKHYLVEYDAQRTIVQFQGFLGLSAAAAHTVVVAEQT